MADPATDAQIEAQARLRALVAEGVRQVWRALPSHDEESVAPWLAVVVPLVAAAMRTSVALSDAYVARLLGRRPLGIDPTPVLNAVRGAAAPEAVYRRPFVQTWTMLSEGKPFAEAVVAGEGRAAMLAATDVQLAQRSAMQAVQRADPAIRSWRRVADPDACRFCRLLDGSKLLRADAAPMHPECGCAIEPSREHVEPSPLPEGVVVHEHGELGAVTGDPGQHFLTEAAALVR